MEWLAAQLSQGCCLYLFALDGHAGFRSVMTEDQRVFNHFIAGTCKAHYRQLPLVPGAQVRRMGADIPLVVAA